MKSALPGGDVEPPTAPLGVTAAITRVSGEFCSGNVCTSNSCGSHAGLQLEFQPVSDNKTAQPDLGYRLRFIEGNLPPQLEAPFRRVLIGMSPLGLELTDGFDAVVDLDATFELVALDRNGNESQGSEPFRVAFDGCTTAPTLNGCVEDLATPVVCSQQSCVQSASEGCSLARGPEASGTQGHAGRSLGGLAFTFWIAGLALLRRRCS